MSFRIEKKFRMSKSEMIVFEEQFINQKKAEIIYPKRRINSIYFDNPNLASFHDSEEGVLPRKKIRIRWYNNLYSFYKEEKISSEEGRFKIVNDSQLNSFDAAISKKYLDDFYGLISPSLIVVYDRSYYSFKKIRITIDKNITYQEPNNLYTHPFMDDEFVVELKTDNLINNDYVDNLLYFPNTRFSKYCRGINYLELS